MRPPKRREWRIPETLKSLELTCLEMEYQVLTLQDFISTLLMRKTRSSKKKTSSTTLNWSSLKAGARHYVVSSCCFWSLLWQLEIKLS